MREMDNGYCWILRCGELIAVDVIAMLSADINHQQSRAACDCMRRGRGTEGG